MPNPAEVSREGDNLIKVSGCLDVTSVAHYRSAGVRLIDEVATPVIDLANARVVGSAAIALLIAWQRYAEKCGKQISFTNPPDNLMDIARACGVDQIITLSPAGASP